MLPAARIGVTSAVRLAGSADFSGYFRVLDLGSGRVQLTVPIPESSGRAADPNPRGGVRGAKGMSAIGDRFVVANSERLFVFDPSWELVAELTHPLLGAVHDVLAEEDGVWVTCTACDLLLKLGWDGTVVDRWSWRDEPSLVSELGFRSVPPFDGSLDFRDPRAVQQGVHNIVHLNGVVRGRDGLLLSFGRVLAQREVSFRRRKALLARLLSPLGVSRPLSTRPTPVPASAVPGSSFAIVALPAAGRPGVLLRRDGIRVPNHNVDEVEGGLVYLDSNDSRLVVWDSRAREERQSVAIPGEPGFARGLARVAEGVYLVGGQAPLAVYTVDLGQGGIVASLELEGVENESVYGICVLPPEFGDLPPAADVFSRPGRAEVPVR